MFFSITSCESIVGFIHFYTSCRQINDGFCFTSLSMRIQTETKMQKKSDMCLKLCMIKVKILPFYQLGNTFPLVIFVCNRHVLGPVHVRYNYYLKYYLLCLCGTKSTDPPILGVGCIADRLMFSTNERELSS